MSAFGAHERIDRLGTCEDMRVQMEQVRVAKGSEGMNVLHAGVLLAGWGDSDAKVPSTLKRTAK